LRQITDTSAWAGGLQSPPRMSEDRRPRKYVSRCR
jgi:hypothetical protein